MKTIRLLVILPLLLYLGGITAGSNPHALDAADGSPTDVVYVNNDGKVGIGTTSPQATLDVRGNTILDRYVSVRDYDDDTVYTQLIARNKNWMFWRGGVVVGAYDDAIKEVGNGNLVVRGLLGIGTTSPTSDLHICDPSDNSAGLMLEGNRSAMGGWANVIKLHAPSSLAGPDKRNFMIINGNPSRAGADNRLYFRSNKDDGSNRMYIMTLTHSGNVGIGTSGPKAELDVVGRIRISSSDGQAIMELGEGLDYAEGFDVSDKTKMGPGSVLIIDADNPGKLALSCEPYDSKVAGIVAGAKGKGSGVRLGPEQFDFDVALAGRVYCNVDATEVGVEPGDLLTTSIVPGYAMKAVDHARAQGAILGKAMEKLEKGKKDQILVLVTLQ